MSQDYGFVDARSTLREIVLYDILNDASNDYSNDHSLVV